VDRQRRFLADEQSDRRRRASGRPRPQPIDSGIDGWFLDRLLGRR
jgi:hypothetical protein